MDWIDKIIRLLVPEAEMWFLHLQNHVRVQLIPCQTGELKAKLNAISAAWRPPQHFLPVPVDRTKQAIRATNRATYTLFAPIKPSDFKSDIPPPPRKASASQEKTDIAYS